jgi:hypothetical protein
MNNFLGTDRWISSDPLDNEIIEVLFKKDSREGEEKLIVAVLSDAIEQFQKHVLSKDERGRRYSGRWKIGFWRKMATTFSPLSTSVRPWSYNRITYVKG